MTKNPIQIFLFLLFSLFISQASFAWNHSIEFGYGQSVDPNNSQYKNSGFLLSGDIYPLKRTDWTFWSITGSAGKWHSTAPINKNLTTLAASLALRLYPFNIARDIPTYILGSAGPAYLSKNKFGTNTQARNITIQTNLGLGVEIKKFDVNLRLEHFSNANLGRPNQGFNILYLLSVGYLF